ncbi:Fur family transcriptional regulator [Chloroflexota bacterium]
MKKDTVATHGRGKRMTAQRDLLLKILREARRHMDVHELHRLAREKRPGLSLSTVYRNLRLFRDMGLVEEHRFDGARCCYEARPRARHHHLVCLGCGRITEFSCPMTEDLKSNIGEAEGFVVTDADVLLTGYCFACREKPMLNDMNVNIGPQLAERR